MSIELQDHDPFMLYEALCWYKDHLKGKEHEAMRANYCATLGRYILERHTVESLEARLKQANEIISDLKKQLKGKDVVSG
jgi:hypothetical protein